MKARSVVGVYLVSLLFAIALAGCTTKGINFESGLTKLEAGEYEQAIKVFKGIAEGKNKYTNRARFYMGECYKLQFKWDEAVKQFQMVSDAEKSTYLGSEARNRIAQINEGRKDIERLKIIHDNNPKTDMAADALLELSSVYENKLSDYQSAIKTNQQLMEEYPGTAKAAQAQVNVGNIYFYRLYDYQKGWDEFQKVSEKNYPELKYRIAEVKGLLLETNKLLGEIREHQAFIRDNQKKKELRGHKVTGYEMYGVKQDQVAQSFLAVGKKWRQLRNYPKSIEAYRILIRRIPLQLHAVAEARFSIAEIYQSDLGQYFDAIDTYLEYIKYHPTDFRRDEAVYNLAICYETIRQYGKAYDYYKTYRDSYPDGKYYKPAELKVRQYEYDEDQDGFPYYKELEAGTSDTDPNQHP